MIKEKKHLEGGVTYEYRIQYFANDPASSP